MNTIQFKINEKELSYLQDYLVKNDISFTLDLSKGLDKCELTSELDAEDIDTVLSKVPNKSFAETMQDSYNQYSFACHPRCGEYREWMP